MSRGLASSGPRRWSCEGTEMARQPADLHAWMERGVMVSRSSPAMAKFTAVAHQLNSVLGWGDGLTVSGSSRKQATCHSLASRRWNIFTWLDGTSLLCWLSGYAARPFPQLLSDIYTQPARLHFRAPSEPLCLIDPHPEDPFPPLRSPFNSRRRPPGPRAGKVTRTGERGEGRGVRVAWRVRCKWH